MREFWTVVTSKEARKFHIALAGALVAGLQLAFGADNELVTLLITALTAAGVYRVPNRKQ